MSIKSIKTLSKTLENVSIETLAEIVANDDVFACDTATKSEKLSILVFAELAKALKTKDYELQLSCNYAACKKQVADVKYYRYNVQSNQIQLYFKSNRACNDVYFDIVCSARKDIVNVLQSMQTEIERAFNMQSLIIAKCTCFKHVAYTDVVKVIKFITAVTNADDKTIAKLLIAADTANDDAVETVNA